MRSVIAALAVLLNLVSVAPVTAVSHPTLSSTLRVDLDGRQINPRLTSRYYCHDLQFPAIHCSRTEAARDASMQKAVVGAFATLSASDYVVIYDGPNFSGPSMVISQNYDALFTIGWNDRISSYRGVNSASGRLWTDWFGSGTLRTFCCNTLVSTLPSGLDNAFSSVYRT
jgi:hypothetical protein